MSERVDLFAEAPAPVPNGVAIEEPETPERSFPDCAWRGAFATYRNAMDGTTEASDVAHFATFWAACAARLGRKLSMFSGIDVYANTYLCFYGPSNDKKTTAQRRIRNQNLLGDDPDVLFLSNAGSTEGTAEQLTKNESGVSLMLPEELSSLFGQGHWEGSTLMEFLTETFDCPDKYEKPYRKNPISLEKPTPNIFGCSTPTWFWKHARADDFAGGFANRFLYLTGPKKPPIPEPQRPDPHDLRTVINRLEELRHLPVTQAKWSTDAVAEWKRFYVSFEACDRSPLLAEAMKRGHVYVRKLAMTYAALEGTLPVINTDQLKAATEVIQYAAKCTELLIDLKAINGRQHSNTELEKRFLDWIKKRGASKVRDLQQAMSKHCDSETFNRVVKSLEHSDQIDTWWDDSGPQKKRLVCLQQ